jgi:glycerol-3-phosphate acyltransferase PlsY
MPELTSDPIMLGFVALASYLLGSVSFGMIIARVLNLGNLREIGSGNIGATNVLRTGNKKAAFLTLVLDAGKGAVAVLLARYFVGEDAAVIAALASFLGHLYPVYLRFKGGKGVATFLGTALALNPMIGLVICLMWLAVARLTKYSSLAALVACFDSVLFAMVFGIWHLVGVFTVMAALVFYKHRENIGRLLNQTEPKIGKKT